MSSLDKMVEQILSDAAAKARSLEEEGAAEAARLTEQAAQERAQHAEEQLEQARAEAGTIRELSHSAAVLERKRMVLAAKQQMISGVIEEARARLQQLPAPQYFEMIGRLAARSARPLAGQICLNQRDLDRLPKGWEAALNQALPAGCGALSLSKIPRDIDGGFVLVYGGVEENCSLSALFESAREDLQDVVQQILFAP